jgi:hypothetical protein
MSAFDFSKALNIPANAILPFNPMRTQLAIGTAEYVAIEVIVSKLLRSLLRISNKGFLELAYVHAVSVTFMGGAQGFADAPDDYEADVFSRLKDGAKGIPAVLLAKYTVDTCFRGFHVPFSKWSMADIVISAASKALTRPIFGFLYPLLKNASPAITNPLDQVDQLVTQQVSKSNLKMTGG